MIHKSLALVTLLLLLLVGSVQAQTTCDIEGHLACSHVSIESCRATNNCLGDGAQAVSAQDLIEDVAAKCCSFSTKKKITKCVKKAQRKLTKAKRFPGKGGDFAKAVRKKLNDLKTTSCSTGTLGDL